MVLKACLLWLEGMCLFDTLSNQCNLIAGRQKFHNKYILPSYTVLSFHSFMIRIEFYLRKLDIWYISGCQEESEKVVLEMNADNLFQGFFNNTEIL